MQNSDHICYSQLNLSAICTIIGQLGWEKINLIRALKHLTDICSPNLRFEDKRSHTGVTKSQKINAGFGVSKRLFHKGGLSMKVNFNKYHKCRPKTQYLLNVLSINDKEEPAARVKGNRSDNMIGSTYMNVD